MTQQLVSQNNSLSSQFAATNETNTKVINELKKEIELLKKKSFRPSTSRSGSLDNSIRRSNSLDNNSASKQPKLQKFNFVPPSKPTHKPVIKTIPTPSTPISNKVAELKDDVDSDSSDDYNSDPEFAKQRQEIRRNKKRKRTSGNSSNEDGSKKVTNSKDGNNPNNLAKNAKPKDTSNQPSSSGTGHSTANQPPAKKLLPPPPMKVMGIDNFTALIE